MTTTITPSPNNLPAPTVDVLDRLAGFLRLNVAEGDASEHTIRAYLTQIGQFVNWCAEIGIDPGTATDHDLATYRRALAQAGYKRSTIGVMLASVRRFYEAAIWRGLRQDNPAAGLKPPRDHTSRRDRILERYLSQEEVDTLLGAPDWSPSGIRDRAMMSLMYYHGLRVSEIAALTVGDIIPGDHRQLAIREAKGSKDRNVFLIEETAGLIDRWTVERAQIANDKSGEAVFLSLSNNNYSGPLSIVGVRSIVNGYLKDAGLYRPGLSCHALRHAHATHALMGGAELKAVSWEMGHANIDTTGVYTHVADAIKQNPAEFLRRTTQEESE